MDAVEQLEGQISDLLMQLQRPRITPQVKCELQAEIDRLDLEARAITAQQREAARS